MPMNKYILINPLTFFDMKHFMGAIGSETDNCDGNASPRHGSTVAALLVARQLNLL
jgi:hypothetical protein